jgi:hypothetical protein
MAAADGIVAMHGGSEDASPSVPLLLNDAWMVRPCVRRCTCSVTVVRACVCERGLLLWSSSSFGW